MSQTETETASEPAEDAATLEDLVADNPDEVARFIERLGVVNELLDTADLATAAMDDEMVSDLAATGTRLGEVADTATDDDVARTLEGLLEAGSEPAEPVGPIGVAKALRDLDVKAGMGFLLSLAKAMGRTAR